jgi:toxin FitB
MELELGTLPLARREPAQATRLRGWMDRHLVPEVSERTLPIDVSVALRCGQLHVPDTCYDRDANIAATAPVRDMTVVTGNVADFASTGVALLNPWEVAE